MQRHQFKSLTLISTPSDSTKYLNLKIKNCIHKNRDDITLDFAHKNRLVAEKKYFKHFDALDELPDCWWSMYF